MSESVLHTETINTTGPVKPSLIRRIWRMDTAMELCSAILVYSGIYDTTFLHTVFSTLLKWKKIVLNA